MTPIKTKTGTVWIWVLGLIALVGFGMWIRQLILGLAVTGMNNYVSWGLYIITFAFMVGLSAGGLIVSSLAYILKLEHLKQMAPVGIVAAVACVVGAGAMILVDVGHPERVLNILLGGRLTSPIKWDFFILAVYLVVGLFELYVMLSKKWLNRTLAAREHALNILAWIGFPVAILVHSITAWIFGLQIGRPFWNTALMAPIFLSSAVVSGVGLLLLVAFIGDKYKLPIPGLDEQNRTFLTKLLSSFILLDAFFLFCDLFTSVYAGGTAEASTAAKLLTGNMAPLFWLEIILGVVAPFLILVMTKTKRSMGWQAVAGVLVMVGVFLKRINIILPNLLQLNVPYAPGVSTGRFSTSSPFHIADQSSFAVVGNYFPTLSEVCITLGVLAFVALLITVGIRLTMAVEKEESVAEAGFHEINVV